MQEINHLNARVKTIQLIKTIDKNLLYNELHSYEHVAL